jgi:hypothetical protein
LNGYAPSVHLRPQFDLICQQMLKIRFLSLLGFFTGSICAQTLPEPSLGWDSFKEEIILKSPEIDSQLNKVRLIIAHCSATVNKSGQLTSLEMIQRGPLNGNADSTLLAAMKNTLWKPGLKKGKAISMTFTFTFFLERKPLVSDSTRGIRIKDSANGKATTNLIVPAIAYEEFADFPGGQDIFKRYIIENFQYPEKCNTNKSKATITATFKIDAFGSARIVRTESTAIGCPEFVPEAARVIEAAGRWIPAVSDGKYISSYMSVPISVWVR